MSKISIEIPQYLRAEVEPFDEDCWRLPSTKNVLVYIGEAIVFTHEVNFHTGEREAVMEAMTAFGQMLALKIQL